MNMRLKFDDSGSTLTMLADATPGRPWTFSSRLSTNRPRAFPSGYRAAGIGKSAARVFRGSKPGLTCRSRIKLLTSNPAPISRITATAVSAVTSRLRRRWPEEPAPDPRPPSFRIAEGLPREVSTAGASPKRTPVASESAAQKPTTLHQVVVHAHQMNAVALVLVGEGQFQASRD